MHICLYLLNHNFTNSNWCVIGEKTVIHQCQFLIADFFSNHYFRALPPSWMFDALNNLIFFFFLLFLWQLVKFNYATTSILDHHPQSIIFFFFSHNGIWWSKWIPPLSLKHLSHFNLFPFLSRKEIANHFLYLTSSIAPNLMLLQFYFFSKRPFPMPSITRHCFCISAK